MGREGQAMKTENGWVVKVVNKEGTICLRAEDGELVMPNYEIHVLSGGE